MLKRVFLTLRCVKRTCFHWNMTRSLHTMAGSGNVSGLRAALSNGENINKEDGAGWTPLHWAVMESQHAATTFLLQRGASVAAKDEVGHRFGSSPRASRS